MHTYPSNSVSATLLDNSSEGSSPQSSASNEEEVQELLQRASASGSISDSKPIYNFSIPDMIQHRSAQDLSSGDAAGRRGAAVEAASVSQRRSSGRRLRQAYPLTADDQSANCRPRKFRRVNGRNTGNAAAFIDLTHSPEVYGSSPSREPGYCVSEPQDVSSYRRQDSEMGPWLRDASLLHIDQGRSTSASGDTAPSDHILRHTRASDHMFQGPHLTRNAEGAPPASGMPRDSHPLVINLDDSPRGRRFEPMMVASARQSRLHRRDIISEVRAQLRSQLEHSASQGMRRVNDISFQGVDMQAEGGNVGGGESNGIGQDEVQFVGEWRPHRHVAHASGMHTAPYTTARRARLSAEARGSERLAFVQSLLPHLPNRRGISTDYFLPYMPFDVMDAPPLHHLAAGVDATSMEGDYEALWRLAERLGPAKPKGLSKADIEKIEAFRFSSSCMASTNMTCVICMSEYNICEKLRRLSCSHDFHSKCIDKWLKSNKTCPVCRDEVKT